jgi:hypothetical protein
MTGRGAVTYKETHEHELKRHQIAVESDIGNVHRTHHHTRTRTRVWNVMNFIDCLVHQFDPYGFGFTGSADGLAIFRNLSGTPSRFALSAAPQAGGGGGSDDRRWRPHA